MNISVKKPDLHQSLYIGIALLVVLIGIVGFVQFRKKDEFKTENNPQKAREVAESLLETVGRIYVLPKEVPTVATVTDVKDLPDQNFYKQAENGDKILIFANAQKIILYRPGINKVVDVAEVEEVKPTPQKQVAGEQIDSTSSADIQTVPKVIFNSESQ